VYIQFITSRVKSNILGVVSSNCAYNIFKVINCTIQPDYDHKPVGDKTLVRFGAYYNNLYSKEPEDTQWNIDSIQKFRKQLTNIEDPLLTAKQIFDLPIDQISISKKEEFGPWGLVSPLDPEYESDCIGYADSNYVNNQITLFFKDNVEVVYGVDQWLNNHSKEHPFVFYPINDNLEASNSWKSYYEKWLVVKNT